MYDSSFLVQVGVVNKIAGSAYNFREANTTVKLDEQLQQIISKFEDKPETITTGRQVHGINICDVDKLPPKRRGLQVVEDTDGLITKTPRHGLLIKFADCTPIVIYDPKQKVLAAIHSGWRGTAKKFAKVTVDHMVNNYNCKRADLVAYIGPTIDAENYEVGSEVFDAFSDFNDTYAFFQPHEDKYWLDLSLANKILLEESGLSANRIEVDNRSTYLNPELHSARREGEDYKLNGLLVYID